MDGFSYAITRLPVITLCPKKLPSFRILSIPSTNLHLWFQEKEKINKLIEIEFKVLMHSINQ